MNSIETSVIVAFYNKIDKAVDNLQQAVKNGLEDPNLLDQDPVLKLLADDSGFQSILQHLQAKRDVE